MAITEHIEHDQVLTPEEVRPAVAAFESAWAIVAADERYSEFELGVIRALIARRILDLTQEGEKNLDKLVEYGLAPFKS
jgi:hypothetical protein